MAIERVAVVGCGLMGSGIAQVSAAAGFTTVVREVSPELVDKGIKGIEKSLARLVEKGTITEAAKSEIRGRLKGTTVIEDLKDCDLVVEAIVEQLAAKRELFGALDRLCPEKTIFASNTSSLTITEIATATKRPQRFVGLHFFNPVPVMKLLEVVKTIATPQFTKKWSPSAANSVKSRCAPTIPQASSSTGCWCPICSTPFVPWKKE
jgi:3-hydroxybutyryl-CoA dehydrogenase